MKKNSIVTIAIAFAVLMLNACKKEETTVAPPDPENEVITTVKLVAINVADTTEIVTGQWKDITPNDGNPDVSQARLVLKKNAIYKVSATFLDETKSPAADITTEITERANYHLVCYAPAAGLALTVVRTDYDNNTPKLELGLKTTFTTGGITNGNLQVSLHHQPTGKNGTDCSIGSSDAEVNFSINIM
jgi:hypothetical protein